MFIAAIYSRQVQGIRIRSRAKSPNAEGVFQGFIQERITAETITGIDMPRPSGDWDRIHGEIITFAAPDRVLPHIDRLEGFYPDGRSMYRRVLVPARTQVVVCLA